MRTRERSTIVTVALGLLLAMCGCSSPVAHRPKTPATMKASEIASTINSAMGQHVVAGDKARPLAGHPFHIVFLVDSSQSSPKSAYVVYIREVIQSLLQELLANQQRLGVPPEKGSTVSMYPYQLDLYRSPEFSVQGMVLTPDGIKRVTDKIPQTEIHVRPNGHPYLIDNGTHQSDGHDNTTPRSDLFAYLAQSDPASTRPVIIVQFTANPLNEAPNDRSLDKQIRARDGKSFGVTEAGYAVYADMDGQTESPRKDVAPFKVYMWAYGSDQLRFGADFPKSNIRTGSDASEDSGGRFPLWLLPVLLVAALAGAAAWWFGGKRTIVFGTGDRFVLRRGGVIKLVAEGFKGGEKGYTVMGMPSGTTSAEVLAQITYTLDIRVEGVNWHPSSSEGAQRGAPTLKVGSNDIWLSKGDKLRSPKIRIVVS